MHSTLDFYCFPNQEGYDSTTKQEKPRAYFPKMYTVVRVPLGCDLLPLLLLLAAHLPSSTAAAVVAAAAAEAAAAEAAAAAAAAAESQFAARSALLS